MPNVFVLSNKPHHLLAKGHTSLHEPVVRGGVWLCKYKSKMGEKYTNFMYPLSFDWNLHVSLLRDLKVKNFSTVCTCTYTNPYTPAHRIGTFLIYFFIYIFFFLGGGGEFAPPLAPPFKCFILWRSIPTFIGCLRFTNVSWNIAQDIISFVKKKKSL